MSQDRSFIKSGRNTIIHKDRKLDLVIVNGETHPKIKVTGNGLEPLKEELPKTPNFKTYFLVYFQFW